MLDRYFFIPADNPKFLQKMQDLHSDYFVIDLEESVSLKNKKLAIDNIKSIEVLENYFVRIPIFDNTLEKDQIRFVINKFKGNLIIPKLRTVEEFEILLKLIGVNLSLRIIVLVENPVCLFNLNKLLEKHSNKLHGIGFGSHDFCMEMGIKHDLANLSFYRNKLILLAKVFGINYIDGVDLDMNDLTNFRNECIYSFETGADGKFLIHPKQLEEIDNITYFTENELKEMYEVYRKASSIEFSSFDIIEYNGKYYEKPHILKIEKNIKKIERRK